MTPEVQLVTATEPETYRLGLAHMTKGGDIVVQVNPVGNGMDAAQDVMEQVRREMSEKFSGMGENVHIERRSNGAHNWLDVRFSKRVVSTDGVGLEPLQIASMFDHAIAYSENSNRISLIREAGDETPPTFLRSASQVLASQSKAPKEREL